MIVLNIHPCITSECNMLSGYFHARVIIKYVQIPIGIYNFAIIEKSELRLEKQVQT